MKITSNENAAIKRISVLGLHGGTRMALSGFRNGGFHFLSSSPAEIVQGGQCILYMRAPVCGGGCSGPSDLQQGTGYSFPVTRFLMLTQILFPALMNLSNVQARTDHPRVCCDASGGWMPCSAAPQLSFFWIELVCSTQSLTIQQTERLLELVMLLCNKK